MPAPDDGLPFVLTVEGAFRLTGRGTVIMRVIEQGVLHIGDHLEVIQPSGARTAPPFRFHWAGFDAAPRVGPPRDPAVGASVVILGVDIEPAAIRPGAKLRAAANQETE